MLQCLRPGAGTTDAPRAFNLMLKRVPDNEYWISTKVDSALMICYTDGRLLGTVTVHAHDLKSACDKIVMKALLTSLEKAFWEADCRL